MSENASIVRTPFDLLLVLKQITIWVSESALKDLLFATILAAVAQLTAF